MRGSAMIDWVPKLLSGKIDLPEAEALVEGPGGAGGGRGWGRVGE